MQQGAREAGNLLTAVQTLAAQVAAKDEAVRTLVATTATTVAASTQSANAAIGDRITALEKTSNQAGGKSAGFSSSWAIVVAAITIGLALYAALRH